MNIGFLYGGQGSQSAGMMTPWLSDAQFGAAFQNLLAHLPEATRLKNMGTVFDESALAKTRHTQSTLVAYEVVLTQLLVDRGILPAMVTGLSIGEYAALYAAGVLTADDAVTIAFERGRLMDDVSPTVETGMLAVMGLDEVALSEIIAPLEDVYLTNVNARDQLVLAGNKAILTDLRAALKEKGVRSIFLKVSGAFHSPFMQPAAEELAKVLAHIPFQPPNIPVCYNVTGTTETPYDFHKLMVRQMCAPVRLDDCLRTMLDAGINHFVEVAPQSVMKKLLLKLAPGVQVWTLQTPDDFRQLEADIHG